MTYSGMAESHTTIGAERFHFRVRNGIGWFPFAIAARQTGKILCFDARRVRLSLPESQPEASAQCIVLSASKKRLEVIWSSLTGN